MSVLPLSLTVPVLQHVWILTAVTPVNALLVTMGMARSQAMVVLVSNSCLWLVLERISVCLCSS